MNNSSNGIDYITGDIKDAASGLYKRQFYITKWNKAIKQHITNRSMGSPQEPLNLLNEMGYNAGVWLNLAQTRQSRQVRQHPMPASDDFQRSRVFLDERIN